jgi:hypothetical protein
MTAESLTGVGGVARRHRAGRNTGGPGPRGVAPLAPSSGGGRSGASEGSTVPLAPTGQQNRRGGKGPWFGGRASPRQGAGDGREPDTSTEAPAPPRGAVHQGQAGRRRHPVPSRGTRRFPIARGFGELGVFHLRRLRLASPAHAEVCNPSESRVRDNRLHGSMSRVGKRLVGSSGSPVAACGDRFGDEDQTAPDSDSTRPICGVPILGMGRPSSGWVPGARAALRRTS